MSELLSSLNDEQLKAAAHTDGPLLVLAGAGSGKTRVLTYRVAQILHERKAKPWEILAVTFTNKAAAEMKSRIQKLIDAPVDGMWIGTFHSICARILRVEAAHLGYSSSFTIYDTDDQLRLVQSIMQGFNINKQIVKPRQVQHKISDCKNKLVTPERFYSMAAEPVDEKISKVYFEYEKALRRSNAFDFDDLLIKPLDLFTADKSILEKYQNRFRYILVDEYQDTNKPQYYLVKYLSSRHRNLCVVGDEDQSIYRWRGADIENILSFEKDYPECRVVRLEQNYRSTRNILEAANSVVAHNVKRLGKNLWSEKAKGDLIRVFRAQDEAAEGRQVARIVHEEISGHPEYSYRDVAVLYRTNAQSRALEEYLRRSNIPYTIVGGTRFYDRKEVKDVLAYLRILVNRQDIIALRRIINYPTRGIGNTTVARLEAYADERQTTLYQACLEVAENKALSAGARAKVTAFIDQVEAVRAQLEEHSAFYITTKVVETFGLRHQYSLGSTPEDRDRLENINELLNSVAAFSESRTAEEALLENYLEEVSLLTDIDRWDPDHAAVTLMTLHSAKGLEFPVVIITGMEDGLFPLFRSFNEPDDLEEERRLFYVGMTRAMESLYLLWAAQRRRFSGEQSGMFFRSNASRFLREVPAAHKDEVGFASTAGAGGAKGRAGYPRKKTRHEDVGELAAAMLSGDSEFSIGDWVRHESFGKGQVLAVEQTASGTKLSILFAKKQLKKIIAEYANLQRLGD